MPSISEAVAGIVAAGVPVLFLDTCRILDVIRAPLIDRKPRVDRSVEAALELVAMAAPPACRLIVGSFVPPEWDKNSPIVQAELDRRLKRMDEDSEAFHRLCGHLAVPVGFGRAEYAGSELSARLLDLSRRLLDAAHPLDAHPDTRDRAYHRVAVAQRRPSHKGGELKDCTIFEECLEVCRQLQSMAFARKAVFCTSDTDDYCAGGAPHVDVATDCAAVGLVFTTNLPWAVSELKS